MSTIALVNSTSASHTTTVIAPAQTSAAPSTARPKPPPLTGDALGKQLFVSGDRSVNAIACGSCHTMKAADTTGTIGPNLDKELSADPASATRESTVDPNKEIVRRRLRGARVAEQQRVARPVRDRRRAPRRGRVAACRLPP